MNDAKIIAIAAVAIRNHKDDILHVRKRGTDSFIMVGGKIEPGESGLDAALREVSEEIGLELTEYDVDELGQFHAPAANESGFSVVCDVFFTRKQWDLPDVAVHREIEEARWIDLGDVSDNLAPLSRDVVHPALSKRLLRR